MRTAPAGRQEFTERVMNAYRVSDRTAVKAIDEA